jgi:hypothetical protein
VQEREKTLQHTLELCLECTLFSSLLPELEAEACSRTNSMKKQRSTHYDILPIHTQGTSGGMEWSSDGEVCRYIILKTNVRHMKPMEQNKWSHPLTLLLKWMYATRALFRAHISPGGLYLLWGGCVSSWLRIPRSVYDAASEIPTAG